MISHQTIDERGLAYAQRIVEKIDDDPQRVAVEKARRLCRRWLESGSSEELLIWEEILGRPWPMIRQKLLEPSEVGDQLRQNNPFCGVLTPQERWSIHRRFRPHETPST